MKSRSALYAPLFFGVVLLMTGLSEPIVSLIAKLAQDSFLSHTIVQLLVYLLPLAFYCRVRSLNLVSTVKFKYTETKKIPLILILLMIFLIGSAVLRYFGLFFFDSAFLDTPSALKVSGQVANPFLGFLSTVLLPAVLEECVFRGVLLEEYRAYGMFWSVGVSSLMFAMAHASLSNFIYYLFMGVTLGLITYLSDSIVPGVVCHILINYSYFHFRPSVIEYLRQAGKSPLLPYILIASFLLMFVFLFGRLENMYRDRLGDEVMQSRKELLRREVEKTRGDSQTKAPRWESFLSSCREILLSPTFLGTLVVFVLLLF